MSIATGRKHCRTTARVAPYAVGLPPRPPQLNRVPTGAAGRPLLPKGVAHVSFRHGGLFLPVRSPVDRRTFIDVVAARVRTKGLVQLLIDDQRWIIRAAPEPCGSACVGCGLAADAAGHPAAADGGPSYCLPCILAVGVEAAAPLHERTAQAGRRG